jgi:hypothetical protein
MKTYIISKIFPIVSSSMTNGLNQEPSKENKKRYPFKFRLYDGDNATYFDGYSNDDSSFDPLDDLQESYGVTTIKYFENGEWVEL